MGPDDLDRQPLTTVEHLHLQVETLKDCRLEEFRK